MKLFKGKDFKPEEEIEDLYGPPIEPEIEPEELEALYGPPPEFEPGPIADTKNIQMTYGPPGTMSNMNGFFVPPNSQFNANTIPPTLRGTVKYKPSTPEFEELMSCYNSIRKLTDFRPKVALVLGSGLGSFAETSVDITSSVDYSLIDGFPMSTVEGHKGRFVFGYIGEVPVVVMQGRVHYYEGYSAQKAVMPTRLMSMLGAEVLFLTNASGGINADFSAGDFMLITDHISTFAPNPLVGKNLDELGTRFPDMSKVYDPELRSVIELTAKENGIKLQKGVYLQLSGPSFETPAEIRMLRTFGADAVGMSTVVEAIAANHAGMRVCGISCISNLACGMTDNPLTHAEVQESADKAAPRFRLLVSEAIKHIGEII